MRFGILCTMINGFGRKGYYNSQEIGLGRGLARCGHTVYIYKSLKKDKRVGRECLKIEKGLSIQYIPVWHFGAHGYFPSSVLDKDLDAVLCFADNQIFLPHIYRFCQKNKICFVPYIGTMHSNNNGIHGKILNTLFALGSLKIYRKTPVIAKIRKIKTELEKLGVKNVTVAPVGLDFEVMKKDFKKYDKGLLRAQFGFDMDEVIICTVSRLDPEKRPLDLLDIFMRVKAKKKCKLLIVGEGVQSLEVEKRIEVLGLENEVKVLNRVPYEDIWKVYAISDYFVNLCGTEIFGMAILEAMYYEVSVAASIAPGPSVTLKGMKGHKLCITDQDVEDWLAGKYPEKKELAESAEKLKEKYGWDSCANVFLSIVSGKKDKNRKEKRTRV